MPRKLLSRIVLPASLPTILAGARIAANLGLSITIALELLLAQDGLGAMIWLSWQTLKIEDLFAAITCLALIGISFRLIVNWLARRR